MRKLGVYKTKTILRAITIFILALISIPESLDAQYMEVAGKSKLIVGSYLYEYDESEHFFNEVPEGMIAYRKSLKKYKAGKGFGYTSLGALGLGTALIFLDQHQGSCDFICLTTGQVIGILSIFVVFPVSGTIGLLSTWSGKKKMKEAAGFYNKHHGFGRPQEDIIGLSFGLTQSGIGFVVNF